jgi:hypothetical protein
MIRIRACWARRPEAAIRIVEFEVEGMSAI